MYRVVLMLSVGVTARRDSVTPAPKPARTVRGPVILPSASARSFLYWSKATNPAPRCQFWLLISRASHCIRATYESPPWPSCQ